jgi:hypothetical protein
MGQREQNLVVGMPASTRITSRSAKCPAPLRGFLPHPQLDRGLTEGLGQLRDFRLELLLARRRPGLTGGTPAVSP